MNTLENIKEEIHTLGSLEKAKASQRFFKTKEGEYGYGDVFVGLTVPQSRAVAKRYFELSRTDVLSLLQSKYHEERLIALFILIHQFQKGDETVKKEIYDLYLANTVYINNWDLIDSSAGYIVGGYLYTQCHPRRDTGSLQIDSRPPSEDRDFHGNDKHTEVLTKLAYSENLWERRISIIATFPFIMNGESDITFTIAEILLHDTHDLIHKAVGWLLREVGKRVSEKAEKEFLNKYYKTMPRTMLRYAIERFTKEERKAYLLGQI